MRRALIVGIDHYASAPLQGGVADAASVADVLSSNADGSRDWSVDLLVSTADGSCTIRRDVLRGRLTKLLRKSSQHGSVVLFRRARRAVSVGRGSGDTGFQDP